jgi:ElaB/YqjD/DUF883 family membrane-anchored ribosome-binding protein
MNNEAAVPSATDSTRSAIAHAKSVIGDAATRVQDKAADIGRSAGDALHAGRGVAADKLDDAALKIHDRAEQASELGHAAANRVGQAGRYVREHGAKEVMSDVEELVRTHPGKSLLVAVAVGFLAARAFRSNND